MVKVKLIDSGKIVSQCYSSELLQLNEEFYRFPAQAVDIRISGIVPYDYDIQWVSAAKKNVKKWLEDNNTGHFHIQGRIVFSALNTLWVDTLKKVEKLPNLNTEVMVMSITKNLLSKHFAVTDNTCLKVLREIAHEAGNTTLSFVNSNLTHRFKNLKEF